MKSHISATIDSNILQKLKKVACEEKRSLSNLLEIALEKHLSANKDTTTVVVSDAKFAGSFSRQEIYERNRR